MSTERPCQPYLESTTVLSDSLIIFVSIPRSYSAVGKIFSFLLISTDYKKNSLNSNNQYECNNPLKVNNTSASNLE